MTTELQTKGITRDAVVRASESRNESLWLTQMRTDAFDLFESLPMPSRIDEEWRRTDIRGLDLDSLAPYPPATASAASPLGLEGGTYGGWLTQQGGTADSGELAEHIADSGVIFCSLDDAVRSHADLVKQHLMRAVASDRGTFEALNAALWSGGVFLYVPRGVDVALPLRSLYGLTSPASLIAPRTLIVLEPGARVTYVEEYAAAGGVDRRSLCAGVVEAIVGQEAQLTLVTLQEFLGDVYDLNTQRVLLDRDSSVDWLVIGLGDGLTKSNIEVSMQGLGARCQMLGILWGYGRQHTDYHTLQDHQAPNCNSDLLYKAALTDEAQSVFAGRIRVEKGAHRTDSYQANRTVILSDHASVFPSPNLEIEANDVRCTHGASIGKVDADQLFYLMSRGLSRELATKMIIEGFFEDVLQREPAAIIRDNLRSLILRKIENS